jgi:hypothetical protein
MIEPDELFQIHHQAFEVDIHRAEGLREALWMLREQNVEGPLRTWADEHARGVLPKTPGTMLKRTKLWPGLLRAACYVPKAEDIGIGGALRLYQRGPLFGMPLFHDRPSPCAAWKKARNLEQRFFEPGYFRARAWLEKYPKPPPGFSDDNRAAVVRACRMRQLKDADAIYAHALEVLQQRLERFYEKLAEIGRRDGGLFTYQIRRKVS